MTPPVTLGAAACFANARIAAEQAEFVQQRQAARRVAEHARDAGDCLDLLTMLGLSNLAPTVVPPAHPTNMTFPDALGVSRPAEADHR
ncbi:hypothetical protein [Lentzea jiangxiensis]|uniref:Uncharacterized protein n=1 Tax=Lentzea jiangxiensis TaxID=641025 RepID=A0A1H0JTA0_9PSEU|nr:hypothetical protein [Lentzea jiangxiensis]SDO46651.1 hypothetical protein SAMN05421507_102619 [Lentzea jiangxiensis]